MAIDIKKLGKLSLAIVEGYVESKLGTKFVDELRAPTDKTIAIATALNETENIFKQTFADKDLAKALFVDLTQQDRPELIDAVGKYYDHPTDPTLRTSLQRILFDEFKQYYTQEVMNHAVDVYLRTLTKELMLADETFRDNVASLAMLEGSLAEKQTSETLNKIYETMAGWTMQQQSLPPAEVHPTIGFIPAPKVEIYIDRGQIEDDLVSFLLKGGRGAIVGVHAPGGLGKTELAKKTAQKLKSEYEVLWVDVGNKETQQVMGEMLMKCGMQVQPTINYEQLKNELQSVYLTKRYLVIFDDVRKNALDKLSDLLPPRPSSALVTSRMQQIGGVQTFPLKEMTWQEASQLFRAILKDEIFNNEEETLKQLAERCKFNPLAMEIAARNILQKQGFRKPVALYFEQAQTKFSALKAEGDERWDMHAIFDISYEELNTSDQEKFRWLSAFHPTGFSVEAVSYLWKTDEDTTRQVLSRFINLSLVKPVPIEDERIERYRLHDLLDEYAYLKLKSNKEEGNAKLAFAEWVTNLFDKNDIPSVENLPYLLPERDNLLHACEWARGEKQADILALLTTKTRNWFYVNFRDAWVFWFAWLEACLQLGVSDKNLEANVRKAIGDVQQFRKENNEALESYNEALKLFRQVGAKLGEANVRKAIGDVQQFRKENNEALESYNEALKLFRQVGDKLGEANVLQAIGDVQQFRKENNEALESYNEALKLFRQVGAKLGEANVRKAIGDVQQFRKENNEALESYNEALKLFRQVGDKLGEANVRKAIGDVQQFRDERDEALESYNEALKLFRQVGAKLGEANVRKAIGDVQQFRKENNEALESYNEALKLFRQVGAKLGEANVLQAIGDVQQFRKENNEALESYNEALKLFRQVGAKLGEANVLQAIGDVQQFRKENNEALESYNEALKLFRQVGAKLGEANVLQAIGDVQQFRKENNEALESYNEALKLFRQVGAKLGEANVLQAIGDVQQFRDERDEALESYNEALKLFRQVGAKLGEANVRKAIGDVQQFRKENNEALESYNEALKLFRQVGAKLGEANVRKAIGDVQQFRKENNEALESYNEALKLFRQVGDKLGEANVRKAIGDVQQFRKENNEALESYNEALKLFRQVGDKLGEANVLQAIGKMQIINANDQESFQTGMNTLQSAMGLYEETKAMAGQTNILMFLSRVSASMGQNDKAIEIAQAALKLLIQVAGENHPVTLSFVEYIKELESKK